MILLILDQSTSMHWFLDQSKSSKGSKTGVAIMEPS
jgi:hypothetical protein